MHNMSALHKACHTILAFSECQTARNVDTIGYVTQNCTFSAKMNCYFRREVCFVTTIILVFSFRNYKNKRLFQKYPAVLDVPLQVAFTLATIPVACYVA